MPSAEWAWRAGPAIVVDKPGGPGAGKNAPDDLAIIAKMAPSYGCYGSFCTQKVYLTLAEKDVTANRRMINIGPPMENYEPWYARINPRLSGPDARARRQVHLPIVEDHPLHRRPVSRRNERLDLVGELLFGLWHRRIRRTAPPTVQTGAPNRHALGSPVCFSRCPVALSLRRGRRADDATCREGPSPRLETHSTPNSAAGMRGGRLPVWLAPPLNTPQRLELSYFVSFPTMHDHRKIDTIVAYGLHSAVNTA